MVSVTEYLCLTNLSSTHNTGAQGLYLKHRYSSEAWEVNETWGDYRTEPLYLLLQVAVSDYFSTYFDR